LTLAEEALLRFERLAKKGYDITELEFLQGFMDEHITLSGSDSTAWGSTDEPTDHAPDLIQVVDQRSPSTMGKFFRDKFLLWMPRSPTLQRLVIGSTTAPDKWGHYNFSNRRFEVISLLLGNLATSILIYVAVTSLYLTAGSAARIAGVIIIAATITACSVLFQNQQFISMIST